MKIGERLSSMRKIRGYSQRALAYRAGVSNTTIARIESDVVEPDTSTIEKLASALDVSTHYLMGWTNDRTDYSNPQFIASLKVPPDFNGTKEEYAEYLFDKDLYTDLEIEAYEHNTPNTKHTSIERRERHKKLKSTADNEIELNLADIYEGYFEYYKWGRPILSAYSKAPRPKQEAVCTVLDIPFVDHDADYVPEEKSICITVFDYPAAAGVPLYATDDYENIDFPESKVPKGADFGIRIQGDSMQPTIKDGVIVFVRKQSDLQNGQIGIFMIGEEACCKRFYKEKSGCRLESDNPKYEPIRIDKDAEGFYIAGLVLGYR